MREQFLQSQPNRDPLDWLGYRTRLRDCERHLVSLGEAGLAESVRQLREKRSKPMDRLQMAGRGLVERLNGGLTQRLVGYRGSAALRLGPLSSLQRKLLIESEFVLAG